MKKVTKRFHAVGNEKLGFLYFEINRMNIKKFNAQAFSEKTDAIEWYDDCIKTLETMRGELKKELGA